MLVEIPKQNQYGKINVAGLRDVTTTHQRGGRPLHRRPPDVHGVSGLRHEVTQSEDDMRPLGSASMPVCGEHGLA